MTENEWAKTLSSFIFQAEKGDLKTSSYPKEFKDLQTKISFGMGMPARIPWIAFIAPEMKVSRGYYPVYLYYKESKTLILAYGISETSEFEDSWPVEIMNSVPKITAFFDKKVPRYGDSYVFKAYKVDIAGDKITYKNSETGKKVTSVDIEADLSTILEYYKKTVSLPISDTNSEISQGLFYMEKQLEDFIVHNWKKTDLGKKYDLIIEEGELASQQYRTDIEPIDILARDKKTKDYVVIELKKNQTSDSTVGQLARYMGWVKEKMGGDVKGVIIAGQYDRKLDYALSVISNVEVFIYQVGFKLDKFENN